MKPARPRRTVACACCDRIGPHKGRGLITPCYDHYYADGTLHEYPRRTDLVAAELAELDRGHPTLRALAERLGVSTRTIQRHRARRREATTV